MDALAHPDIRRVAERLQTHVPLEAQPHADTRLAAVAAVLRVTDQPELLFIKRAEAERDPWSGHVAFPGGRAEPGDASLLRTAVRETHEELALNLDGGVVLGQLDDLAPRTRSLPAVLVRPFVAIVPRDVTFTLSHEVAQAFWVPIAELRAERSAMEHVVTVNGVRARFPAYRVDPHVVWGLTERIVRQLLSLFDP